MQDKLDIVYGRAGSLILEEELATELRKLETDGTMYIGYPLFFFDNSQYRIDVLFTSQQFGIVVFDLSHYKQDITSGIDDIRNHQNSIYFAVTSKLNEYPPLRQGRKLAVEPLLISVHQDHTKLYDDNTLVSTFDDLKNFLVPNNLFSTEYYRLLNSVIQRSNSLRPKKKRADVRKENS